LYNGALRRIGERKLSLVTDNVPQRHHLDTIWDEDPIQYMLEKYIWTFALKTVEWNYNSAIEPDFGHQYAFDKPSDYVRLASISTDEYLQNPLRQYEVDGNYFYCDWQTFYLKYVSNDAAYGFDYSLWPKSFENMVAIYMAKELVPALNKSKADKEMLDKEMKEVLMEAKNVDYMEIPTRFPPQSSWARSRRYGRHNQDSRRGPVFG
jgi:hypothetical protein